VTAPRFDSPYHAPVLVAEVLDALTGSRRILDGTLGGGGHSLALLETGATVTALDRDPEAIASARVRLAKYELARRFHARRGNFSDIESLPTLAGLTFDGVLLDLGLSSHQVDDASRGFSFREGAPLDMRMGGQAEHGEDRGSAADFLNTAHELELMRIFREYGDEQKAGRLAREIVRRRGNRAFATSDDLVGAIRAVLGPRSGPPDFARIFQAVRIAVNDELGALARALPALRDRLEPGGVFAVIAYHSGEDRLVKQAFREWSLRCVCPPKQPICTCRDHALGALVYKKAVTAAPDEMARNPRSRSARLRAWRAAAAPVPAAGRAAEA
jgi:16S rRNA (cytosine1402-N4)-methyltransferase